MPFTSGSAETNEVLDVLVVIATLLFVAMLARGLARAWISTALAIVVLGTLAGPSVFGLFDLGVRTETVHLLAGLALATVLFSDAASTDLRGLRGVAGEPVRLLTIGLLGTIALGTLLALPLFGELTIATALILATIVAPTDAALGAPVVTDPSVPPREREVLTLESGLNDGLAVPILLLALGWAGLESGEAGIAELLLTVLGLGVLVGVAVSGLVAAAWIVVVRRWGSEPAWGGLVPLLTAVSVYLLAELVGGSGFIAAFVGGLVFGEACRRRIDSELLVDESVSNLLQGATWFIFGALLVGPVLLSGDFDIRWLVYAVLALTVVRMLPVWLALLGTHQRLPTLAFLGWFGPRGLASVVFLVIVIDLSEPSETTRLLVGTVTVTVLLSILLHGLTARPLAARYGAWAARGRSS